MPNLAKARSKALRTARTNRLGESRSNTIRQIRAEGYEDYSYGASMLNPYKGKEAEAYSAGWAQAHLEMAGSKS